MKPVIVGNAVGLTLLLLFLGNLLSAKPGSSLNFLGMWAAFALLILAVFLAAVTAAVARRSFKLWLIVFGHLVLYVLTFERLVVYLALVKNLHDRS